MEKLMTLSKKNVELIRRSDADTVMKCINVTGNFGLGDSLVSIGAKSCVGEVYKNVYNGATSYYIVAHPMGETMAFCYILYPKA